MNMGMTTWGKGPMTNDPRNFHRGDLPGQDTPKVVEPITTSNVGASTRGGFGETAQRKLSPGLSAKYSQLGGDREITYSDPVYHNPMNSNYAAMNTYGSQLPPNMPLNTGSQPNFISNSGNAFQSQSQFPGAGNTHFKESHIDPITGALTTTETTTTVNVQHINNSLPVDRFC